MFRRILVRSIHFIIPLFLPCRICVTQQLMVVDNRFDNELKIEN